MAMLAERRERKRYNLVPRGKALYEDEHRYGTRILEKMGWSKGKGLGAKESGSQEFVRIRYKNDNQGLGFEDRNDQWTEHEAGFDGLLKALNSSMGCDSGNSNIEQEEEKPATVGFGFNTNVTEVPKICISGESLEEKSKQSRARVHYMKFTRGKDISRYSEKDLANIFGKKSLLVENVRNLPEAEQRSSNESSNKASDNEEGKNPTFGVTTINSGTSVNDYFKAKMQALRNKSNNSECNDPGKTLLKQTDEVNTIDECNADQDTPKEKEANLRKRHLNDEDNLESDVSKAVYANEEDTDNARKKKKVSKVGLKYNSQSLAEQCSHEDQVNVESIENLIQTEETTLKKKKRKKSKHLRDETPENCESLAQNIEPGFVNDETEIPSKKKKQKRRDKCEEESKTDELNVNIQNEDNHLTTNNGKKSKRKIKIAEICNEVNCEKESSLFDSQIEQVAKTRKSKAKSFPQEDSCEIIPNDDQDPEIMKSEEVVTGKKKKKDSKKSLIVETSNQHLEETGELPNQIDEKSKELKISTQTQNSECVNSNAIDNLDCSAIGKAKKSKKHKANREEKEAAKFSYCDNPSGVLPTESNSLLQQVSTPLTQVATSHQGEFRFPELKPKRRKARFNQNQLKKANSIEVEPKTDENEVKEEEEEEEGCKYKVNSIAAEKFYNIDIYGFPGSNLEDILGYGLSGRVKIEIQRHFKDALRIKKFYGKEMIKEEAARAKCSIYKLFRQKNKRKTNFPGKLV